jgi:chemotaxis protein MotA
MDRLTFMGLAMALIAIIGGSILKGAGLGVLFSVAAFLIVIVGTFAAILVQTRLNTLRRSVHLLKWVIKPPLDNGHLMIARMVEWSTLSRKLGLLALESKIDYERDSLVRKGLQMLVDGSEPEAIRNALEIELSTLEQADMNGARVFESMGVYAPNMGLMGAVLGLMVVMQNLSDPAKLGQGISTAFVATVYGIGSANLLFLPVANKIKSMVHQQTRARELLIDGLVAIARGENPKNIESRLKGFLE